MFSKLTFFVFAVMLSSTYGVDEEVEVKEGDRVVITDYHFEDLIDTQGTIVCPSIPGSRDEWWVEVEGVLYSVSANKLRPLDSDQGSQSLPSPARSVRGGGVRVGDRVRITGHVGDRAPLNGLLGTVKSNVITTRDRWWVETDVPSGTMDGQIHVHEDRLAVLSSKGRATGISRGENEEPPASPASPEEKRKRRLHLQRPVLRWPQRRLMLLFWCSLVGKVKFELG